MRTLINFFKFSAVLFLGIALTSCRSTKEIPDASTPEKAIKVKSLEEELEVMKILCPKCAFLGREFVTPRRGNPYDVLKYQNKEDGKTYHYYFNISSFVKQ